MGKYIKIESAFLSSINTFKPDVIYGNSHLPAFYASTGLLVRKPLVFDMHGGLMEERRLVKKAAHQSQGVKDELLDIIIETTLFRLSTLLICVSKRMIEYLAHTKGIPLDRMYYVPNGVNLNQFREAPREGLELRKSLGIGNELVFGYAGGTQPWQGINELIEIASRLNDSTVRFVMAGGMAPSKERSMIILPRLARPDLVRFYSMCDVLVLPRPNELATQIAAPTKFAEYLSMSKPVLTTNVGDAGELVRKFNCGYVMPNASLESFEHAINWFKERTPEEWTNMKKNARSLAMREFDWNKIGDRLNRVLSERFTSA